MKERPILMNAPMVRAILDGRKTVTRRVVKPQPRILAGELLCWKDDALTDDQMAERCPYGHPGDRLWVREAFRFLDSFDGDSPNTVGDRCLIAGYQKPWAPTHYEADGWRDNWMNVGTSPGSVTAGKLRPGIHMPRWASRITLEIVGVRVERLQDISYEDALAEGVLDFRQLIEPECQQGETADECARRLCWPQRSYRQLWESINGEGSWEKNPWVWVIEFRRVVV